MNPDGTNMSYGICSADEARLIGVKLFMQYGGKPNDPNSFIDGNGVAKIFADVYNIIEQPFKAGPGEVEGMGRVLDVNSDGKISLQDLQATCVKYLAVAENVVVQQPVQSVVVEQVVQQPVQQVVVEQVVQQPPTVVVDQQVHRFSWVKAPSYQPPGQYMRNFSYYSKILKNLVFQRRTSHMDFYNDYRAQLGQIYDQSDSNRDGFLSQDEIGRLITNTYQMTFGAAVIPDQDEVFKFISANGMGDGRIERDEFIRQTTFEVLKMKGWI